MKNHRKEIRLSYSDLSALNYLCLACDTENESDVLRFCLRLTRELMGAYNTHRWEDEIGALAMTLIGNYKLDGKNIPEIEFIV